MTWLLTLGALVPLSASLAACGGGGAKTDKLTSATIASSTTSTTVDVNTQILSDLHAQFDAFSRVMATPKPDDPAIAEHATDPLRTQFQAFVTDLVRKGEVIRGEPTHRSRVISVQANTALVDDCVTNGDRVHRFEVATGRDLGPAGPSTGGSEITMRLEGGTWKNAVADDKPAACA